MGLRTMHAHRFSRAGVETMPKYLDWVIGYFLRTQAGEWAAAEPVTAAEPDKPAAHIFIVGFPRSGTTLLESILGCLPGAVTTDEKDGLGDGVREFMATPGGLDRLATLRGPDLVRYRELYWQRMRERGLEHKDRIFVDKQPYNTVKLPLIAKMFPDARIVFMVRNPRDVILSCFRQRFRMNPSNFELLTLESAASLYDQTMRLGEIYRAKLPLSIRQVRHEDIVSSFESEIRALCDFLKVPWNESMRTFQDRARTQSIATPSANQVAKGLSHDGTAQWRNYADQIAPVVPVLEPWVKKFGYDAR
ncbi:MAG TPA: sulfotransferase [Rhizomicrobium sp.]|nr:sulfotransferase [Rhizomicrobium sp.]